MDIGSILEEVRKGLKLTKTEYSKAIGVPLSTLSGILANKQRPSAELLCKVTAAFPSVSPGFLLTGSGEMFRPDYAIKSDRVYLFSDIDQISIKPIGCLRLPGAKKNAFGLTLHSREMEPIANSGDIVILSKADKIFYSRLSIIILENGESLIRYPRKTNNQNEVILLAENQFYDPVTTDIKQIESVYLINLVLKYVT